MNNVSTQIRSDSRTFVEWFPEQLTVAISGQIQGFVKGGTYSSSRSLKQGVWWTVSPEAVWVTLFSCIKSKNDINHI